MQTLGNVIYGVLPEPTGIPPEPETRIVLDMGSLPWAKPGTYIVDIQAYKESNPNQVTEQGYKLIFK